MVSQQSSISLERWAKTIPSSPMIYPDSLGDRLKYLVWRLYTPFHPFVRDTSVALGIVSHVDKYPQGRQPFILGHLTEGQTVQEFVAYMITKGFGNHFIAWKDSGQVVSLRYVDSFKYQYHLRVFEDGEVRGHYEYTPECHPVLHMKDGNMEERRDDFLRFIGDRIVVTAS
jgi:hypothetical protein